MEFKANEGKSVTIEAMGKTWARHAIETHFVQVGESYIDLMNQYVLPTRRSSSSSTPTPRGSPRRCSPIFWRASSQSATAAAPRAASWAFPSLIPGWFSPAAPLDGGGRTGNENTQGEKAVPPETASLTAALRSPSAFLLFLLFFCFIYMKR